MLSFKLVLPHQQAVLRKGIYALIILILGSSLQPPSSVYARSVIFYDDFEHGFSNWVMGGLWNPESESDPCGALHAPFPSPTTAVYYGNDLTCTYHASRSNAGNLTMTSQVSLPTPAAGRTASLTFWSFANTDASGYTALRMILVSTDGGRNWNYLGVDQSQDAWNQLTFDLTDYLGKSVLLRFKFMGPNPFRHNQMFGWLIDNVAITMNDSPVAQDDYYITDEDILLVIAAPGVLGNDSDLDGNGIIVTASDIASVYGAAVTVNPDGSFTYDTRGVSAFQALPGGAALEDTFNYTISDGSGNSAQATVHVTVNGVNDPPVLQPIRDYTIDEETLLTLAASATDIDSNILTFSLDTGAPAGAIIDPTSGQFSWTPSEAQGPGAYPITVRVTDNGSPALDATQPFTVTVNEVNQPPQVNAGSDQSVSEGQVVEFAGGFSDPDLPPPPNGFTIQWDFGDGAKAQGSLTPAHVYADNGVYTVTLTIDDGSGGRGTDTLQVTVTNVPPSVEAGVDQTGFTDQPVHFSGRFTDPGTLDTHQIVWTFGDGASITGTLTPSHSFKLTGVYPVTQTVTDKDGGVGSDRLNVTVEQSIYSIYMPVLYTTGKPDLVGSFSLSPQKTSYKAGEPVQITVVVTNQGKGPAGGFWVDFYINPSQPPTGFTQTWDQLCSLSPCFGLAWYIEGTLNPGESRTLTSTVDSYSIDHSYWVGWLASGTSDLYLVVDSWNSIGSTGLVNESDETNNRAELHGLQVTGPNPHMTNPQPEIR